MRKGW